MQTLARPEPFPLIDTSIKPVITDVDKSLAERLIDRMLERTRLELRASGRDPVAMKAIDRRTQADYLKRQMLAAMLVGRERGMHDERVEALAKQEYAEASNGEYN